MDCGSRLVAAAAGLVAPVVRVSSVCVSFLCVFACRFVERGGGGRGGGGKLFVADAVNEGAGKFVYTTKYKTKHHKTPLALHIVFHLTLNPPFSVPSYLSILTQHSRRRDARRSPVLHSDATPPPPNLPPPTAAPAPSPPPWPDPRPSPSVPLSPALAGPPTVPVESALLKEVHLHAWKQEPGAGTSEQDWREQKGINAYIHTHTHV